jgi:hypothetical protein
MELSPAAQIAIIDRQIAEWRESSFSAEIAHKVHTRLKSDAQILARFVETMERAEIAITALDEMRAQLAQPGNIAL